MRRISYKEYFDKVFGCWMGKSVAGTIGAPSEGRKELLDFEFDPESIKTMLPNDDLDLQVLWLDVIEKKGIYFETSDLAEAFYTQCPYNPGEYGVFKKNYARGIKPPVSGTFNNRFYIDGMGCPIRSEIWACISPGNTALASRYAEMDGIMDHGRNSVEGEIFFACLEAEAFFNSDIEGLLNAGLSYIPAEGKVAEVIRSVIMWYNRGYDWKYTRGLIINHYGHPDCTNLYQNIAFIILALLYGKRNFIDTTMIALNCGFDTDCTCATAGAVLGIIYGAEYLMKEYELKDTGYDIKVKVNRKSNLIYDLAEDTCRAGLTIASEINKQVEIYDTPVFTPVPKIKKYAPACIHVDYLGTPAIGLGESKKVVLHIKNNINEVLKGVLSIAKPEEWVINIENVKISIAPNEDMKAALNIWVPDSIEKLDEINIFRAKLCLENHGDIDFDFGIAGASVWHLYGPFWDNNVVIPKIRPWERYGNYIICDDKNERADLIRAYHLNTVADMDKQYMDESCIGQVKEFHVSDPGKNPKLINIYEDKFNISDYIGFQGPCVVYMLRYMYSPQERNVHIQVGNTDAFKLWINDNFVGEGRDVDWWTAENKHYANIQIKKGINKILFKAVRRSTNAEYSIIFTERGACSRHYPDFSSMNPDKC